MYLKIGLYGEGIVEDVVFLQGGRQWRFVLVPSDVNE